MIHKDGSECTVLNFKCIEMRNLREENEKLKLNYLKLSDAHTDSLEENEKLKAVVDTAKKLCEWGTKNGCYCNMIDCICGHDDLEKALRELEQGE